jgi:predicted NAD/FAD-dependent oxidoreductase
MQTKSCLIVGAGIAGLTAAGYLSRNGWRVTLLDKGRGPGGRMAMRRAGNACFDHGAQFFTVRDARFQAEVDRWIANGWATPWFEDGGHIRYRGVEGMRGVTRNLAQPLDCRFSTKVDAIELVRGEWRLKTGTGEEFRAATLLLTPPAPQSIALLSGRGESALSRILNTLQSIEFDPCLALLVTLKGPSRVPSPGYVRPSFVRTDTGPVAFIADNQQKGISPGAVALTIHASAGFSRSCFEAPPEEVARQLLDAAEPWLGSAVEAWQLHRWKYSQPVATCPEACLYTAFPAPLAVAGDAFAGPRIEGAFLSGLAAAKILSP